MFKLSWLVPLVLAAAFPTAIARGATPSVDQALQLEPVQRRVPFDVPPANQAAQSTIKAEKLGNQSGWVVRDVAGQVLRMFVDTNNDNVVDLWCYYQDGIEIYRDIDADYNGKADQYRWLNTGGSRWAVDSDEDGRVDSWKTISAEEVSAEVVAAIADKDAGRFERLVLTAAELADLGLGEEKAAELAEKIKSAPADFKKLLDTQTAVGPKTAWAYFGGTRPGVVPSGSEGSTKDVTVYENVLAMIETGSENGQVHVGTLIRVGDVWRLIAAPVVLDKSQSELAGAGYFFKPTAPRPAASQSPGAPSDTTQKLLADLEKLDEDAAKAVTPAERAAYNARRADLLEDLAKDATEADRIAWMRQMADTVSAAVQSDSYPNGVERLKALHARLGDDPAGKELASHVKYCIMTAEYGLKIQSKNVNFPQVQTEWLASLEQYTKDYPQSPDTADVMLQLAIAQEFAGQEDDAKKWYGEIVKGFADTPMAKKAAGARKRLDSVGKKIEVQGATPTGGKAGLAELRGKTVLIHYWATTVQPAVDDLTALKQLQAKYGKAGFALLGVSLDSDKATLAAFLKKNRLSWPQIYEQGSLDSRLALELGILTLPTMILVDGEGRVLNRNVHVSEIEGELKRHLK